MTDLYFVLSNTLTAVNGLAYPHCNGALKGQQNNAVQCTPKTAQKEPKAATYPPNNSHSNLIDDSQQARFHRRPTLCPTGTK